VLLLTGLAVAIGCSDAADHSPAPVILITLDTVRADHLGCYGYRLPTSPALDQFASAATLYMQAKATAPWTLPSHASLFTGQYPFEHAAHTNWVDTSDSDLTDNVRPLGPAAITLAEHFSASGYATAGFAANTVFLMERYGLSQGFDTYEVEHGYAPEVNARARGWLDAREDDRPFFLFLNYMDAHSPYNTAARDGWPGGSTDSVPLIRELRQLVLPATGALPRRRLERMRQQYDLGIANLDAGLGELFGLLRERKLFERSLIVIASDHGEYFGEHHLIAHSKDVFEPVIAVPLMIKAPGQTQGLVEERLVSLAHVPSLMQPYCPALHEVAFSENWPSETVISENHFTRLKDLTEPWAERFPPSRFAIYEGDSKLIRSSDGPPELYDLATDPPESTNRAGDDPAYVEALLQRLEEAIARGAIDAPDMDPRKLSAEEIKQLEALGYF
jgi:arylsulfatase A-like enzyme